MSGGVLAVKDAKNKKSIKYMLGMTLISTALLASGCSSDNNNDKETAQVEDSSTIAVAEASSVNDSNRSKTLVVYFSYGENIDSPSDVDSTSRASISLVDNGIVGNTGVIARMIQKDTNADMVSLKTVEKYSAVYNEATSRAKAEIRDDARPALATHIDNIDNYDTIFVGYPNWGSDMPKAVYTFFDEYDLSGKTIFPFSTSGGSGLSNTVNTIKNLEPNAQVRNGFTVSGSRVSNAQNDVDNWLRNLGYLE